MNQIHPQVKYTMSTLLLPGSVESCISTMKAKLVDFESQRELASCELIFVNFALGVTITDCHDLLDVEAVTYEFVGLFDSGFELDYEVAEKVDFFLPIDKFLVVHNLHVLPEFRGRKLSKVLIDDIAQRFVGDTDMLALKAYPLENNTPETTESLLRYYESIGFVSTGVNDILVRA
ncbi:GNAT family N-acetyltransferase [Vibrio fluvialis]|uniref:GNAT family N-acetyltransferase n=1 Tax=Vibrio fluvialis TaxID=676 RepID=UPI001EECCA71|nr:GNAT family N-acetyltransferase [Vibrio fluvialis]MCG6387550.1 GNAT family N-acetyltransferase [Vibrio fluvialis]